MKPSQKAAGDLLRSLAEAAKAPESSRPSLYRAGIDRHLGFLPPSTREEIFLAFENKRREDVGRASDWLIVIAGIFLLDYDGGILSNDEWGELRDILAADAGELDMDILSYAMTLVVEHKAL